MEFNGHLFLFSSATKHLRHSPPDPICRRDSGTSLNCYWKSSKQKNLGIVIDARWQFALRTCHDIQNGGKNKTISHSKGSAREKHRAKLEEPDLLTIIVLDELTLHENKLLLNCGLSRKIILVEVVKRRETEEDSGNYLISKYLNSDRD